MPQSLLTASVLDEDAAHRFGRCCEKMSAVLPALVVLRADQSQVGLVNQGRRLERLTRVLPGQLLHRQLAQLPVDQRK